MPKLDEGMVLELFWRLPASRRSNVLRQMLSTSKSPSGSTFNPGGASSADLSQSDIGKIVSGILAKAFDTMPASKTKVILEGTGDLQVQMTGDLYGELCGDEVSEQMIGDYIAALREVDDFMLAIFILMSLNRKVRIGFKGKDFLISMLDSSLKIPAASLAKYGDLVIPVIDENKRVDMPLRQFIAGKGYLLGNAFGRSCSSVSGNPDSIDAFLGDTIMMGTGNPLIPIIKQTAMKEIADFLSPKMQNGLQATWNWMASGNFLTDAENAGLIKSGEKQIAAYFIPIFTKVCANYLLQIYDKTKNLLFYENAQYVAPFYMLNIVRETPGVQQLIKLTRDRLGSKAADPAIFEATLTDVMNGAAMYLAGELYNIFKEPLIYATAKKVDLKKAGFVPDGMMRIAPFVDKFLAGGNNGSQDVKPKPTPNNNEIIPTPGDNMINNTVIPDIDDKGKVNPKPLNTNGDDAIDFLMTPYGRVMRVNKPGSLQAFYEIGQQLSDDEHKFRFTYPSPMGDVLPAYTGDGKKRKKFNLIGIIKKAAAAVSNPNSIVGKVINMVAKAGIPGISTGASALQGASKIIGGLLIKDPLSMADGNPSGLLGKVTDVLRNLKEKGQSSGSELALAESSTGGNANTGLIAGLLPQMRTMMVDLLTTSKSDLNKQIDYDLAITEAWNNEKPSTSSSNYAL